MSCYLMLECCHIPDRVRHVMSRPGLLVHECRVVQRASRNVSCISWNRDLLRRQASFHSLKQSGHCFGRVQTSWILSPSFSYSHQIPGLVLHAIGFQILQASLLWCASFLTPCLGHFDCTCNLPDVVRHPLIISLELFGFCTSVAVSDLSRRLAGQHAES